ncbi:MAG: GNAT family N-acetyltransferase [Devosia sp.]
MSMWLETERLRLEDWSDSAIDELFSMHANPDVQRYLDVNGAGWSREKAETRLAGWRQEHADIGLGKHRLVRRSDGTFVGRAGFSMFGEVPEIGYSLARDHWGNGYATEIAAALSAWYFATRTEDRFIGFAHHGNTASQAVLRKIGMAWTHTADVVGMPHEFFEKRRIA